MVQLTRRYWSTADAPTNSNLEYLESLARHWDRITVDQFMDKIRGVIAIWRMLPKAVARHFDLPSLFIGASAYDWSNDRLQEEARTLCNALENGLAKAFADPDLAKRSDADFSDRPPTRGEEIREALDAYREDRSQATLTRLRHAASGTHVQRYVDQLDKWVVRKRPSSPGRPIEYEIACVLGDIGRRIGELHGEAASYDFTQRQRRSRPPRPSLPVKEISNLDE